MQKSHHNHQKKSIPAIIYSHLLSLQFLYLFLLSACNIIIVLYNTVFTNYNNVDFLIYISLGLIGLSAIIKIIIIIIRKKTSCKQFFKMQISFIIPYVLTIINMILYIQCGLAINDKLTDFILLGTCYLVCTFICSMLMSNATNSKFQFFSVTANLVLQASYSLQWMISSIYYINDTVDDLKAQNHNNTAYFVNKTINVSIYNSNYDQLAVLQKELQNTKDLSLACIASILATLLILIDMIGRPLQKKQHSQQINKELEQKYMRKEYELVENLRNGETSRLSEDQGRRLEGSRFERNSKKVGFQVENRENRRDVLLKM